MEIYFSEHEDLRRGQTVLSAHACVGERTICSKMYVPSGFFDEYQVRLDSAYHMLKVFIDSLRNRFEIEHSQKCVCNRITQDKVDWKKEGF